jgi:hypothetical protein
VPKNALADQPQALGWHSRFPTTSLQIVSPPQIQEMARLTRPVFSTSACDTLHTELIDGAISQNVKGEKQCDTL